MVEVAEMIEDVCEHWFSQVFTLHLWDNGDPMNESVIAAVMIVFHPCCCCADRVALTIKEIDLALCDELDICAKLISKEFVCNIAVFVSQFMDVSPCVLVAVLIEAE